jgi:hypothetical protein
MGRATRCSWSWEHLSRGRSRPSRRLPGEPARGVTHAVGRSSTGYRVRKSTTAWWSGTGAGLASPSMTGEGAVAQVTPAFLPLGLLALGPPLQGRPDTLLALPGAHHQPALLALGQLQHASPTSTPGPAHTWLSPPTADAARHPEQTIDRLLLSARRYVALGHRPPRAHFHPCWRAMPRNNHWRMDLLENGSQISLGDRGVAGRGSGHEPPNSSSLARRAATAPLASGRSTSCPVRECGMPHQAGDATPRTRTMYTDTPNGPMAAS